MTKQIILHSIGILLLAATAARSGETNLPAPVTEKPDAAFHQAVLQLTLPPAAPGKPALPVTVYIAFRGGQGTVEHVITEKGAVNPVTWSMGGPVSLWDVSGVRLDGKQLTGTLRYSPTFKGPETVSLPVAATVGADGAVTGKMGELAVTGTLLSAEQLAKANAFGPGKDWPQYEGPSFNMRGAGTDRPYRENIAQPRLVWMSEERFGAAREHRMDAMHGWTGSWTPVMGEGKIFYMVQEGSAGSPIDEVEHKRLEADGQKAAAAIRLDLDPWGRSLAERIRQVTSIEADDLAVAIDAASGRTLWRTRMPKRGFNPASYNKHADHGRIGAYADGKVYLMGRTGRIYCLDAASGKVVWEGPASPHFEKIKANALAAGRLAINGYFGENYPVLHVAGPVVVSRGVALDKNTGAKLWEKRGPSGVVLLGGKPYVVVAAGKVALIEPDSGKVLWETPVEGNPLVGDSSIATTTLRLVGDLLIAGTFDRKTNVSLSTAYRLKLSGLEQVWQVKQEDGMFLGGQYNSTLAAGKVVLRYQNAASGLIKQRLLAVNASSGAIEQSVDFKGVFIGQVAAMDDFIFVWPDGCHTGSTTEIYAAKDLKLLGTWNPPHVQTSAYDHPMLVLYVDGRAIVRGRNRMFCYDFRQ